MTRPCPDPLKLGAYAGVTVAVLGAGGFIGRWVSRRLTAYGARLIGVVRNRGAARAVWERYGVRGDLEELDLLDLLTLAHWLERIRPAIVFNLAGYGVRSTERNPDLAERTNHAPVEALGEGLSRATPTGEASSWCTPVRHLSMVR